VQEVLGIFKALSDETRLRIIKLLRGGELCVCDIVAALDLIQPKISFHLAALREAGLIKDRREGKWTHYSLNDGDMFRRFILSAAIEKIPQDSVPEDMIRLEEFIKNKNAGKILPLKEKRSNCCGR
jgi:ArsR family transcriptional regulator